MTLHAITHSDASLLATCQPRWLGGGRKQACERLRINIGSLLAQRASGELEFPICLHTNTWVGMLTRSTLCDIFKPIKSWIRVGWALYTEDRKKVRKRSIALF